MSVINFGNGIMIVQTRNRFKKVIDQLMTKTFFQYILLHCQQNKLPDTNRLKITEHFQRILMQTASVHLFIVTVGKFRGWYFKGFRLKIETNFLIIIFN